MHDQNVDHSGKVYIVRALDDVGQELAKQVFAHRVNL